MKPRAKHALANHNKHRLAFIVFNTINTWLRTKKTCMESKKHNHAGFTTVATFRC